jgi:hypothetical protein
LDNWHWGDYGFLLKEPKGKYQRLEMHTGGWSGNEEIMTALQDNAYFFLLYWQRSKRGGHYYFKIPVKK